MQAIKPVKPNLYMVTGEGGNVTVWVGNRGLVLVDDKNAGAATFDRLVAAIRSVSTLPVRALFDTHHHPDHIGNNDRFLDARVLVIGTSGLAAALETANAAVPARAPLAPPNLLFDEAFSLVLDTGRVDAHHYAPAHTGGDAIIYFPALKTVAMGDLLVATTPRVDYVGGGSVAGWITTLDRVLVLDFDTAIPGHGDAPLHRADVEAFRARLVTLRDRARAAVRAGATQATLLSRIRIDDLGWTWPDGFWTDAQRAGLWREFGNDKKTG